jgi:hypothetical protein
MVTASRNDALAIELSVALSSRPQAGMLSIAFHVLSIAFHRGSGEMGRTKVGTPAALAMRVN